jgi:CubicO group peptidase (beta-lactamase class C family)
MRRTSATRWRPLVGGMIAMLCLLTAAGSALAVSSSGSMLEERIAFQNEAVPLDDPDELADFIDPIFAQHMDEHEIPGAAFSLVKDGEIFLSRSYGYADRENDIPVEPERTIFDLGSIGKLFTATAVMQLVEQGLIDLDADVNEYLTEFQVPDTFDEPITMSHLLTHTPGFDERFYGLGLAPGPDEITPLGEHLASSLPPRIRPPGEQNQYSNAGMALAGHIIETVSGQTFEDYVTEHVLEPLGMDRSTYGLPEHLVPDMAIAYETFPPARFDPYETWHLNQKPAAGVRSTVIDMTQFVLAHLNGGEVDGVRILEEETVAEMHRLQFTGHPNVSGSAYGFVEHRAGDRRGLHHGGQWVGFSSLLYLLPDEDVGFIVSYNNGAGIFAQGELFEALLARYFPTDTFQTDAAVGQVVSDVAGTYRWNRIDHHTFMSLPSMLVAQTLEVESGPNGTITTRMSPALIPDSEWVEIAPGVFGRVGTADIIAFDVDPGGDAERAYVGWPLLMTMERLSWYQSAGFHLGLVAIFMLTLVSTVGWPVGRLYRRLRGRRFEMTPDLARARLLSGVIALLIIGFVLGLLFYAAADLPGLSQIPTLFKAMLWMPIIAAVLTLPLLYFVVRLWLSGQGPMISRIHLSVLAVILLGLFPFLYYWNLLGFHY